MEILNFEEVNRKYEEERIAKLKVNDLFPNKTNSFLKLNKKPRPRDIIPPEELRNKHFKYSIQDHESNIIINVFIF